MYGSIEQIKQANERLGQDWFSDSNMQYFGTKIESTVYPLEDYAFFITSEKDPHGEVWFGNRKYTVRVADSQGNIYTVGEFGHYFSFDEARIAIMDKIRSEGQ